MPIQPLPSYAQNILARLVVDDTKVTAALQARNVDRQRVDAELADARMERDRLAEAAEAGRLNKEERGGWDDKGEQIVKRVPDPARLNDAVARVEALEWQRAALLKAAPSNPRLSAPRANHELQKLAGKKLVPVARPKLPLGKNETAEGALPRFREASVALISERKATAKAARTKEEVKAAMRREIAKLADSGLPTLLPMFHGAKIAWPQRLFGGGLYNVPDGVALVAFLLRDELEARLSKLIDFNASAFPDAMTAEDKEARLAELDSEIDVAERLEAACVEQVIADGGAAHHRPDISILAVLSLRAE
ncbi:hypothetical protein [Bradyrhizobium liaoningense]|uniref:hypothetical protein n=1 Tax=Bradyrhizobium liaoningense TaxID=43992 RepID=UPI001BA91054|nr:hypothetical protein [Bradyrhizobium liaoningense]MBR0717862.1 hypothetical protein [Bradyrhizobium liaoningense]